MIAFRKSRALQIGLLLLASLFVLPSYAAGKANPRVTFDTSMGKIVVELFQYDAPITVANFLEYTDKRFYDDTIFHRVKAWFVVQGGGISPFYNRKPIGAMIRNESANGLKNGRGTIAMARFADPDSAASQFFFNVEDNDGLNPKHNKTGYTVFGKVVSGMDVVDAISEVKTHAAHGFANLPIEPVVVKTVRRAKR